MLGPNSFNTPENNDSNSIFIQLKMLDFTYFKYVYLCVSLCVSKSDADYGGQKTTFWTCFFFSWTSVRAFTGSPILMT